MTVLCNAQFMTADGIPEKGCEMEQRSTFSENNFTCHYEFMMEELIH
jgi:primosomal replication protein N